MEEAEEISKKPVPEISSIFKKKRKFEKMKSGKKTDLKNTQATSGYMSLLQALWIDKDRTRHFFDFIFAGVVPVRFTKRLGEGRFQLLRTDV